MKIPVIGTIVQEKNKNVYDFINTIDYPVENLFIVNCSGSFNEDIESLRFLTHNYIEKIHVTHLPGYQKVSASWNIVIKCFMNSPFWILAVDSIRLEPGFLESMYKETLSDPDIGIIHGSPGTFDVGNWDIFLIRDIIIKNLGFFDENSSPDGYEGADYFFRTIQKPIKKLFNINVNYKNIKDYKQASFKELDYLRNKWGDWRINNIYSNPFNNRSIPVSNFIYDVNMHRKF